MQHAWTAPSSGDAVWLSLEWERVGFAASAHSQQRFDWYFWSNCDFQLFQLSNRICRVYKGCLAERGSQNSLPREPLSLRGGAGLLFLGSGLWCRRMGMSRGVGDVEPEVTFRALCGAGGSIDEMLLGPSCSECERTSSWF